MRVAAVDDDVAVFEVGQDLVDERINRRTGFDHQHDLAGLGEILGQLLDGATADDILSLRPAFHEVVDLTVKPLLSILRMRFSPITARPTRPISAFAILLCSLL
jgi:hypothetical protein